MGVAGLETIATKLMVVAAAGVAMAGPHAFSVGTSKFTVRAPAGFCAPQGRAVDAMRLTAAADTGNVTALSLVGCTDTDASKPDYYLVKAPTILVDKTFERAAFLAEMTTTLALPQFTSDKGMVDNGKIEQDFANVAGVKPKIDGKIKPIGVDRDCAYMGGVLAFSAQNISYTRSVSLCLTVVGGKVIGITRYSDGNVPGNVQRHLASARALAMAMKPVT